MRSPPPALAGAGRDHRPSYSAGITAKSGVRGPSRQGLGIDKVAISFPITGFVNDDALWTGKRHRRRGSRDWSHFRQATIALSSKADLYVEVYTVPTCASLWAKLEFNPSRIVDPTGYGLCEVRDLPFTTGIAWDAACDLLIPDCPVHEARLKRLDAARDGTCADPALYVDAIYRVPAAYARDRAIWADPTTCQSGTLYVGGSTTGHVRFYAMHMNAPRKARPGDWRFEVEARDGWLEKPGCMKTLADVSSASVQALIRDRWDWVGMGTVVKTRDRWVHDLYDATITTGSGTPMTDAQKERLIGYVTLLAAGRKPRSPSNSRLADYRRALRQVGVFLPTEEKLLRSTDGRSLDFATGTEVHAA